MPISLLALPELLLSPGEFFYILVKFFLGSGKLFSKCIEIFILPYQLILGAFAPGNITKIEIDVILKWIWE